MGLPHNLRERTIRQEKSNRVMELERIVEVRRRWGKLYVVETSSGRRYLLLKEPEVERFLRYDYEITEGDETILRKATFKAGLNLCYRYLAVRDRSEAEIKKLLRENGVTDEEAIDNLVETLKSRGYCNDRKLVENYIDYVLRNRPSGPHAIKLKLSRLGIASRVIEEVISERIGEKLERKMASELALRKLGVASDRRKAVRRINDFLLRRGFSKYIVNDICSKILRGDDLEGEDE